MRILGIETSCDETGVAVVANGQIILANALMSSMDLHAKYGGVVPEVAARSHIEAIIPAEKADDLGDAPLKYEYLDIIDSINGDNIASADLYDRAIANKARLNKQNIITG